jgi:hypothetical protein
LVRRGWTASIFGAVTSSPSRAPSTRCDCAGGTRQLPWCAELRSWLDQDTSSQSGDMARTATCSAVSSAYLNGAMVLYYESNTIDPPAVIYAGKDKYENEELIRYALPMDVWLHVDKYSSPHFYLRLPEGMDWEAIPEPLLMECAASHRLDCSHLLQSCAQIVKAGSIQGNKLNVGHTSSFVSADALPEPQHHLHTRKEPQEDRRYVSVTSQQSEELTLGHRDVGSVSFYKDRLVKRIHVPARDNAIVNRLNKTKKEVQVDHEAEQVARVKAESLAKKAHVEALRLAEKERLDKYKRDKEERSYDRLFSEEAVAEARKGAVNDEDDDDFFM